MAASVALMPFCTLVGQDTENYMLSEENYPDPLFREYLGRIADKDGNGILTQEERDKVKDMSPTYENMTGDPAGYVHSLEGIQTFRNLESLWIPPMVESVDLRGMERLDWIGIDWNYARVAPDYPYVYSLEGIILDPDNKVRYVNIEGNRHVGEFDTSMFPNLRFLYCLTNSPLVRLDLDSLEVNFASRSWLPEEVAGHLSDPDDVWPVEKLKECYGYGMCGREIRAEVGGTFDFTTFPGFDASRIVQVYGGSLEGSVLTIEDTLVFYKYDTRSTDTLTRYMPFYLKPVKDLATEKVPAVTVEPAFRAYSVGGALEMVESYEAVRVYDMSGRMVRRLGKGYTGQVSLPHGLYILRGEETGAVVRLVVA